MPRLKEVKNLSNQVAEIVSKTILKNLEQHLVDADCEFCSDEKLSQSTECQYVLSLKHLINETPIHAAELINGKIMAVIIIRSTWRQDRIRDINIDKIRYLVAFAFEVTKFHFSNILVRDKEDIQFVQKFGNHIQKLQLDRRYILPDFLHVLQYAGSLYTLNFAFVQTTQDFFLTVGKYCHSLRYLYAQTETAKYNCSLLISLLFQDPETQKIRNKCCSTLKYVSRPSKTFPWRSESSPGYEEWSKELDKAEVMLLQNLPNLRSVDLDVLLEVAEFSVRNKIERVDFKELTMEKFEKLKKICVNLKILCIYESNVNDNQLFDLLHTYNSIEDLELSNVSSSLYENIFAFKWQNLKKLRLMLFNKVQDLKLDILADNLKNLEELVATCFRSIFWNKKSTFKSLRSINIVLDSQELRDMDWCRCFSRKITQILFGVSGITKTIRPDRIRNFAFDSYPSLEYLYIISIQFNFQFVKNIVMNCPRLQKFQRFKRGVRDKVEECNAYFKEQNIDCTLIHD